LYIYRRFNIRGERPEFSEKIIMDDWEHGTHKASVFEVITVQ